MFPLQMLKSSCCIKHEIELERCSRDAEMEEIEIEMERCSRGGRREDLFPGNLPRATLTRKRQRKRKDSITGLLGSQGQDAKGCTKSFISIAEQT